MDIIVFDGSKIYEETVLFFKRGNKFEAFLANEVEELLFVENPVKKDIVDIKDMSFCGKKLIADNVKGAFDERWLLGQDMPDDFHEDTRFKLGVMLPIPADLVAYQYRVTYKVKDSFDFPKTNYYNNNLCFVKDKLKSKKDVNILLYGDSISNAANSSGDLNIPPFEKAWYEKAIYHLEKLYNVKINLTNNSRSGYPSSWGVEAIPEKIKPIDCDLLVVGFGMNDATTKVSADQFENNIRAIIDAKPNCSVILISSILPNLQSSFSFYDLRLEYRERLKSLCKEKSCALIDMTEVSEYYKDKKAYAEISGNNFNHPNDFIYKFYANALYTILTEK